MSNERVMRLFAGNPHNSLLNSEKNLIPLLSQTSASQLGGRTIQLYITKLLSI